MVATSGSKLIADDAIEVLIDKLMPLATVVTPNIPEGEILSGMKITSKVEMEEAAKKISEKLGGSVSVLLKGGHSICDADDLLYAEGQKMWYQGKRIDNPNTHGTGCTLSSAIAANLAGGKSLSDSVRNAKTYISEALEAGLDLGKGSGPLMHNYRLFEEQ